jgi:hypothetical protein
MVIRFSSLMAVLLLLAGAAGCATAPLSLANIQVGRSLNPDRSIASITTLFKPSETIYVSVQTTEAGSGLVGVKWMFGTQVIDEPVKQVSYDGPASTEFHMQNSGGFPAGDYSVEVFLDGKSVGKRVFKVGEL